MSKRVQERGRGQSLVEFALVLPLLLLLMVGLFDAGRAVIFYTELTNASRVGARVAMVNQSPDTTCAGVEKTYRCAAAEIATTTDITPASVPVATFEDADGNIVAPTATVCQTYGACSATVSTSYTFTPVTPIIGNLIGPINLSASTTMAIERTYADP